MPTDYLFLWQPVPEWPEAYIDGLMARFDAAGSIVEDWRCGSHKAIRQGDRAYVFAQADKHRCIFAVGTVDGRPKEREPGQTLPKVPLRLEIMAHPNSGGLIGREAIAAIDPGELKGMRPSGRSITPAIARGFDRLLAGRPILVPTLDDVSAPTDIDEIPEYRLHRRIERNRATARLAKDVHGLRCQACRLDFMELYGELGRDFIEVHHRRPLAGLTGSGRVTLRVATDLAVLCANCHRMIHRLPDPGDVEALRVILERSACRDVWRG